MFTVYVLRVSTSRIRYVGQTVDMNKRLQAHNSGKSRYTKSAKPWKVIYTETYITRSEAMQREKFFKTGKGREFLNNITPKHNFLDWDVAKW